MVRRAGWEVLAVTDFSKEIGAFMFSISGSSSPTELRMLDPEDEGINLLPKMRNYLTVDMI